MEKMVAKSGGSGGNSSGSVVKKERKVKKKLSTWELVQKHIPDGTFAGLLDLLEPHEQGVKQ